MVVMPIYIDLLFILNIYLDFMILFITNYILKRYISLKRIFLGSLIGGLSIFILFIDLNNLFLFILKLIFGILMVICTFSYRNFKYFINNLIYLYLTSIVLGGGLYLFDLDIGLNIILLIILSIIILVIYKISFFKIKYNYNNYSKVEIVYKNDRFNYIGFIDTGNKLVDQYKNRPVNLIYSDNFKYDYQDLILVPYETASGNGILKCLKIDKLIIDNKEYDNSLIGFMDKEIKIDGVDIILNNKYI